MKYLFFGFIIFDMWQVNGGTHFDSIIITDEKAETDSSAAKMETLNEVENIRAFSEMEKNRKKRPNFYTVIIMNQARCPNL